MSSTTTSAGHGACSDRDVRRWLADSMARLGREGIGASLGDGVVAAGGAPVVWVSMTSQWATGRLRRDADGSSHIEAHRFSDGHTLLDEQHDTTTIDQLEALATACANPN